ncbi:MAG: hypothetical protein ABIP44_12300 [Pseudoxanthomonas sp.]
MSNALLRTMLAYSVVAFTGCAMDRASTPGDGPPRGSSPVHTIVLTRGQKTVIADELLTVELTEIDDSRCPAKVTCVWAGHATVTLKVGKPGSVPGRVVIGTEAPDSMGLPGDADYEGHSFHLVELERGDAEGSTPAAPSQRATIKVSRLPGQ